MAPACKQYNTEKDNNEVAEVSYGIILLIR